MTLNEAIKNMKKIYPDFKLVSVVDYDNYFVFSIEPQGYDHEINGEWIGGLIAIDKLFKVPIHFHPLMHDPKAFAEAAKNVTYL